MPDSQQPSLWGPPYQPGDLDALLSGDRRSTPEALRPVERTLDALRAAPGGRELADEAAARAAFRALVRPQPQRAEAAGRTVPAGPDTVAADTLVLASAEHPPALVLPLAERVLAPPDGRPPRTARHRHRRHPARSARRPAVALTGAAVAAVVVIAVAVTGAIPGSLRHMGSGSPPPSSGSSAAGSGHTAGALEGRGTIAKPTPTPSVTVRSAPLVSPSATSGAGTLCREYFEPTAKQSQAERRTLYGELGKAADSQDPMRVFGYCFRYLSSTWSGAPHPHHAVSPGGHPGGPAFGGNPGGGNPGGGNKGSGNAIGGDSGGGSTGGGNLATPGPSAGASGHAGR